MSSKHSEKPGVLIQKVPPSKSSGILNFEEMEEEQMKSEEKGHPEGDTTGEVSRKRSGSAGVRLKEGPKEERIGPEIIN